MAYENFAILLVKLLMHGSEVRFTSHESTSPLLTASYAAVKIQGL